MKKVTDNLRVKSSFQKVLASKKAAFTFLELLIVISIIGILALVAIGSYSGVQRASRLDFATDALVSLIKEQQLLARSGNKVDDKLQCYAFRIFKDGEDPEFSVSVGRSNYVGIANGEDGEAFVNQADFCLPVSNWEKRDILEGGILINSIEKGESDSLSELELYYKPPFARVYEYSNDSFESVIQDELTTPIYNFELGLTGSDSRTRKIEYNVGSGVVNRLPNTVN